MFVGIKKSDIIKTEKGFFIGDPCYVFDENWSGIVEELWSGGNGQKITVPFKGDNLGMAGTLYGDGVYIGSDNVEYCVDAGLIGVTPFELMDASKVDFDEMSRLGKYVEYKGGATVSNDNGLITISFLNDGVLEDIVINTDDSVTVGGDDYDYWLDGWV